ncbi:Gp138 family membrane-puncturing spike protein [Paenibacillus alvei]|uniref:Gp138 family membrane-puncturing spike protein n=1 Tax=Paenibacillus alvei TaxID=44250 RepID=UPI00227FBE73|nr:Gp138 family membrane-puncturing spike protein [Paenibacillus alvei]MCY7484439.1 hypothetical protein [Paenibacillus alvei]
MRVDPAGAMARMMRAIKDDVSAGISVGMPCKVIKFDVVTCTADVQPLIRTSENETAILQNIPALGQRLQIDGSEKACKPSLRAGDIVFVVCADRELRNAMTGSISSADSSRMHDPNDAVIVGVFGCSL